MDKQTLEILYITHNKSIVDIAEFLNIKVWKIQKLLVEYGLINLKKTRYNPFTKACKDCKNILPRKKFSAYKKIGDTIYYRNRCKKCINLHMKFYRSNKKTKE